MVHVSITPFPVPLAWTVPFDVCRSPRPHVLLLSLQLGTLYLTLVRGLRSSQGD